VKPIRVEPEAKQELAAAAAWYERRREGLGRELMVEIDAVLAAVARSPARFPLHNKGPTISPELHPIIFEPFERGDQDRRGLGLGLYIVREIARAHGGDISVESSDTDGTTFLLTLGVSPAR
jgi:C4-dicarboxylate-specific signal transduction histidine kinase